jgi:hypothetical protein
MARKFFTMMVERETRRKCRRCEEQAVAWIFLVNQKGGKNKSSREPVCRKCLAAERANL